MKKLSLIFFNKILTCILFLFVSLTIQSQTITVNDTDYSSQDLVNLLLANSCATGSNINLSSNQSVAYFNSNGSLFPIEEGIIIRSGIATYSEGSYTGNNLSSQVNNDTDADLQTISDQSGQSVSITDSAFLEFDFISYSSNFTFEFLFASNEYGEWQCGFSDVFGFLLTNLTTGITTNLAVVPNTDSPISVRNIRDNQYNSSCNSINKDLFSTYNVSDPLNSVMNMRGYTVALQTSADIIPNNPYKIKLVIGDYNDTDYDSSIFIKAGSFNNFLDLGEDQEICSGDEILLEAGYTNTDGFIFEWKKNGSILDGETNPTYNVTEPGIYELTVSNSNDQCVITGQVAITELEITDPIDLLECQTDEITTFNLTINDANALGLNPANHEVFYYNSINDINNDNPIDSSLLMSYPSIGNETIFIKLISTNTGSFCTAVYDFKLMVTDINLGIPDDVLVCQSDITIDLDTQITPQILNGLQPDDYSINYFTSETDAINNSNEIPNISEVVLPVDINSIIIWARIIEIANPICFEILSFRIDIISSPVVDVLSDIYECTEYTLPELLSGNYFTQSSGNGIQLNSGDIITQNSTIFIYNESVEGCFNESSFRIFLADEYSLDTVYCGEFIVPSYPNAAFYTEIDGPNGTGSVIPPGTLLTDSQTIYFYVEINDIFCLETLYDIVINPLPIVEERTPVITCNSYTLPPVLHGEKYFTSAGGTGTQLFPGDQITTNTTIYLWNENISTGCTNQSSYGISIIDLNLFQDVVACGEYILPDLSLGGYFTGAMGTGNSISEGTIITTSQVIYFYSSEVTTSPNCSDSISFNITIHPIPPVDSVDDVIRCEDDLPVLEPLVNGEYFTAPNGDGSQLFAGYVINNSQTIYIYNSNSFCDAETSFTVEIKPLPLVDNFTDVFTCSLYILPELENGRYYTESNSQGIQLNAGDTIDTTQTIFIYNNYSDLETCKTENAFTINILGIEVDQLADVIACDQYELPSLNVGNYFTEPLGQGVQLNPGDIITTSQTIYIFGENGDRFSCFDESSFLISVFEKPEIGTIENMESCGSVVLPTLEIPGVEIEYYRRPNRVDLIDPTEYTITEPGSRIIYVSAYPTGNPGCFTETLFQVTVYPLLDIEINGGVICIDSETGNVTNSYLLESGVNSNEFTVNWYLNDLLVGTGSNYNATEAGTYIVETIKLTPDIGSNCNYTIAEVIVESSSPVFEITFLNDHFEDSMTIEITTIEPGLGIYEFSIDNGPFQSFPRFYEVSPGEHTVTVRDTSGLCSILTLDFFVLNYPRFFTPNGDGINDTWNILDLKNDLDATILIFNRFGKFVARIKPSDQGWNGYNDTGKKEPSSDYWFIVTYTYNGTPTTFKSHFSLLRK